MTDRRRVFESPEAMLEPVALSRLLGRTVTSVRRRPMTTAGHSSTSAVFERVLADGTALVLKRVDRSQNWMMLASGDTVDREVRVWETGLLDRVPAPMSHAVVACARDAAGYAVLAFDVTADLLADGPVSMDDQDLVLETLAALHAHFWLEASLRKPETGLVPRERLASVLAPSTLRRLRPRIGRNALLDEVEAGWDELRRLVERPFYDRLTALADDPRPLEAATARHPWTLLRGDMRPANVAIDRGEERVVLLDWAIPSIGLPVVDLAFWLYASGPAHDGGPETIIEMYREALQRRLGPMPWWDATFGLAILSASTTLAPFVARNQAQLLPWWVEHAEQGLTQVR